MTGSQPGRNLFRSAGPVIMVLAMLFLGACTRERPTPGPGTPQPAAPGVAGETAGVTPFAPAPTTPSPSPPPRGLLQLAVPTLAFDSAGTPSSNGAITSPIPTGEVTLPASESAGAATPERPSEYTVQPGDTLSDIARRFGLSVTELIAANPLGDPNTLHRGLVLRIPAPGEQAAASATPAPTQTAAAGSTPTVQRVPAGTVHVIAAGETLYSIARRYGVPLDRLAAANNITNPSLVRVGQRLTIPTAAGEGSDGAARRVHVVQRGETLTSIAARYGVTPQQIREANNLSNPNRLMVGQQLIIP